MSKKSTRNRAKKIEQSLPFGWNTSDDDEIKRRVVRANSEEMEVSSMTSSRGYFIDYKVTSGNGRDYLVEIRSLSSRVNSCSCVDYEVNALGTCKHIEKVLLVLKNSGKRQFARVEKEGNSKIEIYVDPRDGKVKLLCSHILEEDYKLYNSVKEFFNSDGTLISDAVTAIPILKKLIGNTSGKVRISHRIQPILENSGNFQEKQNAKEFFLQDIKLGKSSLDIMKLPLYEYQKAGMLHLVFAERGILADEMGLGKTVQAVAASELLRRIRGIGKVLVISPASLKLEWEEQIAKFSNLSSIAVFGNKKSRLQQYNKDSFFYLVNYEQVLRDYEYIQRIIDPDVIILDEAQRIKNWQTQTAMTIKSLISRYAFVLTGTPIENRIDDIYSIMQFLDPKVFGSLFRFNREYYSLDEKGKPIGCKNLNMLHEKLKPFLLRRLKKDIEGELPARTTNNYFVKMSKEQSERYLEYEDAVARLAYIAQRRQLTKEEYERLQQSLAAMRILCDTPYIMDQSCKICPKLQELENILEELFQDESTKIIIFSEWVKMLHLIAELLKNKGIEFAWHTGEIEQKKRREEIKHFKNSAECRVLLSTDSGSIGLNLQAANIVINMDMPWNPAKLEQRIARAWRKHQTKSVQVINLISEDTIEHRMLEVLDHKKILAESILDSGKTDELAAYAGNSLITKLNTIMGTSVQKPIQADIENVKEEVSEHIKIRDEMVARFKNFLCKIDYYAVDGGENKKVFLVVINGDETQKEKVIQLGMDKNIELKVLTRMEYEALCDLSNRGILNFNKEDVKELYQTTEISGNMGKITEEEKKHLKKAIEIFQRANRKYEMVLVLFENEFYEETVIPLNQSVELLLKAAQVFVGYKTKDDIVPIETLNNKLFPSTLPKCTSELVGELRDLIADEAKILSKKAVLDLLNSVKTISKSIEDILFKSNSDLQFEVAV